MQREVVDVLDDIWEPHHSHLAAHPLGDLLGSRLVGGIAVEGQIHARRGTQFRERGARWRATQRSETGRIPAEQREIIERPFGEDDSPTLHEKITAKERTRTRQARVARGMRGRVELSARQPGNMPTPHVWDGNAPGKTLVVLVSGE